MELLKPYQTLPTKPNLSDGIDETAGNSAVSREIS